MTARSLAVSLGSRRIGQLEENEHGRVAFALTAAYRELPERPVLSQSFEDDLQRVYWGKGRRLPAYFANLIPEGPLRDVLEKAPGVSPGDDLGLLAAMGGDLPGAVVISESDERWIESAAPPEPTGDKGADGADPAQPLRFSLAGVQLKFSVLFRQQKLVLPARGEDGDWIVKFHSASVPGVTENEYSCLEWARAAGFEVPDCQILPIERIPDAIRRYVDPDTNVFAIRRYDRVDGARVHQEDFAQVVGSYPERKYEHVTTDQLVALTRAICGLEAADEVVRRVVFALACGNADAHLKNWSLLYADPSRPCLSPLYDQVSTIAWPRYDRELSLKLAGTAAFVQFDRGAFERMAAGIGMDSARIVDVVDVAVARVADAWRTVEQDLPMLPAHREALREHWQRVPLFRDSLGAR